ncbi:MAG TPA: ankyrin repeat domain-containing protein [Candidatus Saccharimonadales bacterium]|nr:ankyrin repeat domain-containing protein [Candidatus Saccharimonadales bacterium]
MKKLLMCCLLFLPCLLSNLLLGQIDLTLLKKLVEEHNNDMAIQMISDPEFKKVPKESIEQLLILASVDNIGVVRKLLQFNININVTTNSGATPFYIAAINGHEKMVKLFLADPRTDINKANNKGITPFLNAIYSGHIEIAKLLLADPRIDINKANNDGFTPFFVAVQSGYIEMVKLLLADPRTNVNKANNAGFTPIDFAIYKGLIEIVKLLLADPRTEVNKGGSTFEVTPLMVAVHTNYIEIVKLLLADPRIDINKASIDGKTSLYFAAEDGHAKIVKLLLADPRIDINKATIQGFTPLDIAIQNDYTEIIHLFDRYELIMRLKSERNILKPAEQLSGLSPEAQLLRRTYIDFVYSSGINIEPFNEILFNRLKDKDAIALMKEIFNPDKIARLIIVLAKDEKYGDLVKKALKMYTQKTVAEEMSRLTPEQRKVKEEEIARNRCLVCLVENNELESDNAMVPMKCCKGQICADCIQEYDFRNDICPYCRQAVQLKV